LRRGPVPRVLLVMPDQWPRALLRAELREMGYDAVGARDVAQALRYPAARPDRGPVGAILVDSAALVDPGADRLPALLERHAGAATVLVAPAGEAAGGSWRRVLHRPLSIGDIAGVIRDLLPLPPAAAHPID
jgi:hypothetical protein